MRVAITGGTGFIGRHLGTALAAEGHEVVLVARGVDRRDAAVKDLPHVSFTPADVADEAALRAAFAGCSAVAHCAGINRERGTQTYERVHVIGTEAVIGAARAAGAQRLVLISFLRARPDVASPYHTTKWAAEELVRHCGIPYTVIKEGITYGKGDHMLTHLLQTVRWLPIFATVGIHEQPLRPVAVEDAVRVVRAGLLDHRLRNRTVAVVGPESLPLSAVVRRVAKAIGRIVAVVPLPVAAHVVLATILERVFYTPLVSVAQVRMLAEGIAEPLPSADPLPDDLRPAMRLSAELITQAL